MAEANEELDSKNQSSEEDVKTEEVDETDDQSASEDLSVLQEKNKKLFERTKKAEAELKSLKAERLKAEEAKAKSSEKQDGYALEDVAVLVSKVSEKEDREIVKKYAKAEGVSLEEALNNDIVKTILKDRAEKRQTAQAANTGPARRGTTKPSAEAIMADVEKGKLPDDAEALAEARFELKKKK